MTNRSLLLKYCSLVIFIASFVPIKTAYSTVINSGTTNTSTLVDNFVQFTGSGTLQVNSSYNLVGNITNNTLPVTNNVGTISFSTTNTLTVGSSSVAGSIGALGLQLNNINFGQDGTLNVYGNVYANTITNSTNNTGTLQLNGTSLQTINALIGTSGNRLKNIQANNASAGTVFKQSFYTQNFTATGVSSLDTATTGNISGNITGQGKIQAVLGVNNATLVFDGTTAAQTISSQIGANGNRINITTNNTSTGVNFTALTGNYVNNLTLTSGVANVNSSSFMDINGSISGSGVLQSSDQTGNLNISGTAAQTISSQLGALASQLSTITVSNSSVGGVTFNQNITAANMVTSSNNSGNLIFSSGSTQNINTVIGSSTNKFASISTTGSGTTFNNNLFTNNLALGASTSLGATATATVSGSISGTGVLLGLTTGSGNLTLNGTSSQTVSSDIGNLSNKLNTITISNTGSGVTFDGSGDIYSNNFVVGGITTINAGGTNNIGAVAVNSNILTINTDATATNISTVTGSTLSIENSGTLNIAGNISGTGNIQSTSNTGNINFNGTAAQSSTSIGTSINAVNNITVGASNQDISFSGNIYANNATSSGKFIFNGTNSQIVNSIINAASLNITNVNSSGVTFAKNITTTGNIVVDGNVTTLAGITSGGITTTGNNGFLTLGGTASQTINSTIGTSTNYLNTITTNNNSSISLSQNVFTNNLNVNSGTAIINNNSILTTNNLTIGSSAILDIQAANLNISGNSTALTSGASTGILQSSTKDGNVTFNGTTGAQNIAFQLGNNSNRLNIITANNSNGINITNDIYANSLVINTTLTASGVVNLVNNITTLNDNTGNLVLNGTSAQNIAAGVRIGIDNLNVIKKLTSITIANSSSAGVTFNDEVHAYSLVLNGGNLTLAGNSSNVLDVGSTITTTSNNSGTITFSGNVAQTVNASVAAQNQRLSNITVNNSTGVTFNNSFFTNNFAATSGTSIINNANPSYISGNITGTGIINGAAGSNLFLDGLSLQTVDATLGTAIISVQNTTSSGIVFNGNISSINIIASADSVNNISFSNGSNVNAIIGAADKKFNNITINDTLASAIDTTFNNNLFTNNFIVNSGAIANINTGSTATIYGNASGAGSLIGSSTNTGNIIFGSVTSTANQSISLAIGNSTTGRLATVTALNTSTGNISFNNNLYTNNFNNSGTAIIGSNGNIHVAGLFSGGSTLSGNGTLTFDGTTSQSTSSIIGSSGNSLGTLAITNTAGVNISGSNIYANNLIISGVLTTSSNLNVNTITNGGNTTPTGSLTLNGTTQTINPDIASSTNRLGTLAVSSGTTGNFNGNIFVNNINTDTSGNPNGSTGTLNLASGKTADVSGNIGGGILQSTVSGLTAGNGGYLNLSGTALQTISTTIGAVGKELNTVTVNNASVAGVVTTANIYSNTLILSGGLTTSGALNVSTITSGSTSSSLTLNSGGTQTVTPVIASSLSRLGTLAVTSGTTGNFSDNIFVNNINAAGILNLASGKTADVSGNITGAGTIQSTVTGTSNIILNGTTQSITAKIGSSSNKLNTVTVASTSSTTTTNSIDANTLILIGGLTTSGALNVSTITSGSTSSSLTLNSGGTQTVTPVIASSLSRLGTLAVTSGTTGNFSDNIFVNNINAAGTLNLASGKTADVTGNITGTGTIRGTTNGVGDILLDGTSTQIISANIGSGAGVNQIGNLNISNISNTIELNGNVYASNILDTSGSISGTGANINFNGTSAQNITATIGSVATKLKNVTITNSAGVTTTADIYSNTLVLSGGLTTSGSLNVSTITSGNTSSSLTLNSGGTQTLTPVIASSLNRLGTLAVTSGTTGNFSNNIFVNNINAAGTLNLASGKTADVSGNITGAGTIQSNVSGLTVGNGGNLNLSGTTQSISTKIGASSHELNTVSIATGASVTATSNADIYANTLNLNGSLTTAGALNVSTITSGNTSSSLTLNGTTQTITTAIATSSSRLGTLAVGTTLVPGTIANFSNGLNYVNNISILGTLNLASGGLIDLSGNITGTGTLLSSNTTGIGGSLVFNGSGNTQTVDTTIGNSAFIGRMSQIVNSNSGGNVVFNNNLYTQDIANNSGTTTIGNSGNIFVAGNITGTGILQGSGTLTFDGGNIATQGATTGATVQNVSSQIGSSSNRLGTIAVNNSLGVNLNKNIYAINLTGTGPTIINTSVVASISGNITNAGTLTGLGTLSLDGTSTQNVSSAIGVSTSNRLESVVVNNSSTAGATLANNLFVTNLTINGNLSLSGSTIYVGNGTTNNTITGTGNLTLNGSGAQTINSQISTTSSRLNSLTVSNSSGVTLNQNAFVNNLILNSGTTNVASGQTIRIAGNTSGSGQLSAAGSVIFDGTGIQNISSSMSGVNSMTINNSNGAAIFSNNITTTNLIVNGNMTINSGTSSLGSVAVNSGTLTLNNNATTTSFINNSGATTVISASKVLTSTGIANIVSGSTLNIGVNNLTSGQLTANSATIANGTNIAFNYSPFSQIILNNPYTFLSATTLTVNLAGLAVTDNSYLTQAIVSQSGTTLQMTASMDTAAVSALNSGGSTIVESIINASSSNSDMSLLQNELLRISTKSEVETSLASLTETKNNMNQIVTTNMGNRVTDIINSRLFNLNPIATGLSTPTGISSGNNEGNINKGWGQVFGGVANQDSKGDQDGFKSNISGVIFGYDSAIKNDDVNSIIGVAFGYSNASINSTGSTAARNTDINSYQVSLYNNNSTDTGVGFYNENIVNLSINKYDSSRNIKVGSIDRIAKANFGGNGIGFKTGIGYNFNISNALLLAPNIAIRYSKLNQDNYQETGAGDIGLKVNASNFNTLASEVGVRMMGKINLDEYDIGTTPLDQFNILPELKLAWLHNLKKDGQNYTTQFIGGGDAIKTTGASLPSNIFNLGIELNFVEKKDEAIMSFKYDLDKGQGYIAHTGSIKYRIPF